MLNFSIHNNPLSAIKADVTIVLIINKSLKHRWIDKSFLEPLGYKAESPLLHQGASTLYLPIDSLDKDCMREAGAQAVRYLKSYPFKRAKIGFYAPESKNPKDSAKDSGRDSASVALMAEFALGALLGAYRHDTFKSSKQPSALSEIAISLENAESKSPESKSQKAAQDRAKQLAHALESSVKEAHIIAESVNLARDLINTPPQIATPKYIAHTAKDLAKTLQIPCKILKKDELKKQKMGAYLAVARASNKSPRLIHLHYAPKNAKQRVVLVGKGLTYDSGGLSLKPADYMVSMKADKSGACAVLGMMNAIAKLKLPIEVHGIMGMAENMIGGNAYKPDDVLISREGKSIEVRNTDAEGRLVLADCLSYAQDLKPDILIDFATLTGACVVGLGEYTSGIMGYNQALQQGFERSALDSGELVAILPFNRHIKKLIESKIADVSNVSTSRYGGAISAGMFLGEFIREEYRQKWLHIDIAGPAFVEKEWDINPYGASGAGVRAGVQFLRDCLCKPLGNLASRG